MTDEGDCFCYGTKEEIDNFEREIVFESERIPENTQTDETALEQYEQLPIQYQKIVNKVMYNLMGDNDYIGYNWEQIQRAFDLNTAKGHKENKLGRYKLSKTVLQELHIVDIYDKENDNAIKISKLIKKMTQLEKTETLDEKSVTKLKMVCSFLLLDYDLLKKGKGKMWILHDEYFPDNYMEYFKKHTSQSQTENTVENTKEAIREYEEYLKGKGELDVNCHLIEERYAAIKTSGVYILLREKESKKNQLNTVYGLISDLYEIVYGETIRKARALFETLPHCDDESMI